LNLPRNINDKILPSFLNNKFSDIFVQLDSLVSATGDLLRDIKPSPLILKLLLDIVGDPLGLGSREYGSNNRDVFQDNLRFL